MSRPNEFGDALRETRERAGVGLRELAAKIGISPPYLSDVENGHRGPLRPETISVAARVLSADPKRLMAAAERDVLARWRGK